MDLTEFFEKTIKIIGLPTIEQYEFQEIRPRIYCNDEVYLSVQASKTHYCVPRENKLNHYYLVEVGFPSIKPPDTWEQYFEGIDFETNATSSVYGYIPIELVQEFIDDHGGIDEEKTFSATAFS